MWNGKLVLKGVLSAEDARIAADRGVDGVIVSSHGGRQLDAAIAPLHALPAIVRAKGSMKVMIDSGIRRGNDVLKAIALEPTLCSSGGHLSMPRQSVGKPASRMRFVCFARDPAGHGVARCVFAEGTRPHVLSEHRSGANGIKLDDKAVLAG